MARSIVTQELVFSTADSLYEHGEEPSIVAVQARIGGGSYSTVKKFLDVWRQQQIVADASAPATPSAVEAKGRELTRAVWAL
ncbi:MAG: DNA-binding protein, partial [Kiritimatiellae bacterium]|nr:DNA-binding protein [Kiritimatiellia bacterium]